MRSIVCSLILFLALLSANAADSALGDKRIAGIRVVGQPTVVFDHLRGKKEPFQLPDIAASAWKEADGKVSVTVSHYENYRMRGPDIENLVDDSERILSSIETASDSVESHYNYHHWISATYTLDGKVVYALVHTEWYACLLNNDCRASGSARSARSKGNQLNSWSNVISAFKSVDGGATWKPDGLSEGHVVAKEGFHWTGSEAADSGIYRKALNHTGLMTPSRIIREGKYFYSIAHLIHRDFSRLNLETGVAPVDKYGYVLIRTENFDRPSSWDAWAGGSQYVPIASGRYNTFSPMKNGVRLNASQPQIIYDTVAKVYVAIFTLYGNPSPIYYMTTSSLENPSWSDAAEISGTAVFLTDPRSPSSGVACNTGFKDSNYVSLIDSDSDGLNFEFTNGDPWLFYVVNPARCGGNNLARDMYRLQMMIDYK